MSDFDINEYPDNTDKVLAAIYLDGPHGNNEGLSRGEIADTTGLSYQKVRTRVNRLAEDGHLTIYLDEDTVTKQQVTLYRLRESVREFAAGVAESTRLFDDVPDEFDRQEIMAILSELSRLRHSENLKKIEKGDKQDLNIEQNGRRRESVTERLDQIERTIQRADEEMKVLHDKTEKMIEERLEMEGVTGGTKHSLEKSICVECYRLRFPYVINKYQEGRCRECYFETEGHYINCDRCWTEHKVHGVTKTGDLLCIRCLSDPMTSY